MYNSNVVPLPQGLHGPTILDDETLEWLLSICPEI